MIARSLRHVQFIHPDTVGDMIEALERLLKTRLPPTACQLPSAFMCIPINQDSLLWSLNLGFSKHVYERIMRDPSCVTSDNRNALLGLVAYLDRGIGHDNPMNLDELADARFGILHYLFDLGVKPEGRELDFICRWTAWQVQLFQLSHSFITRDRSQALRRELFMKVKLFIQYGADLRKDMPLVNGTAIEICRSNFLPEEVAILERRFNKTREKGLHDYQLPTAALSL